MIRRTLSFVIDLGFLLIFSVAIWSIINNSSGQMFSNSFLNEYSLKTISHEIVIIFCIISFVYFLGVSYVKCNSLGKTLLDLKVRQINGDNIIGSKILLLRELALKWFIVIALPGLLFFFNFQIGIIFAFIFVYLIGNAISYYIDNKTIIDRINNSIVIIEKQHSVSRYIYESFVALCIDITLILSLSFVLDILLRSWWLVPFSYLIFISILFYLLTFLKNGRTIGKRVMGIHLVDEQKIIDAKTIIKREILFKFCFFFLLPFFIIRLLGIVDPFHITINVIVLSSFFSLLFFSWAGNSMWSRWSKTTKIRYRLPQGILFIYSISIIILAFSVLYIIQHDRNREKGEDRLNIMGFSFPTSFSEYPNNNNKVDEYVRFLSYQHNSPKDYILNLFKKYDIVVLCENYHGECSQWDMIYDIVSDQYFINNVGHIFTEYGSVIHQAKVDSFLNTTFDNIPKLEKATASLMYYMSGGFYNFMMKTNQLNSRLPDSMRIREHFTDIFDWDYLAGTTRWSISNIEARDSLMANIVIEWYKKEQRNGGKGKCLLVTNYRHAFGYPLGIQRNKNNPNFGLLTNGNQTQYIFDAIPGRTACVVQNFPHNNAKKFFFPFRAPINNGIWDKAFKLTNYKPVGFDAKDSPFGKDFFDMYSMRGARINLKYQDFFTGIIFDKPFSEMRAENYPYQRYAAEQEIIAKYGETNVNKYEYYLNSFSSNEKMEIQPNWTTPIYLSNFISIILFAFVSAFTSILIIVNLIIRGFKFLFSKVN